jgi:hypothetical protein
VATAQPRSIVSQTQAVASAPHIDAMARIVHYRHHRRPKPKPKEALAITSRIVQHGPPRGDDPVQGPPSDNRVWTELMRRVREERGGR